MDYTVKLGFKELLNKEQIGNSSLMPSLTVVRKNKKQFFCEKYVQKIKINCT